MENGNQLAFPVSETQHTGFAHSGEKIYTAVHSGGLTKREMFAMAAMQGIMSGRNETIEQRGYPPQEVALWSIQIADELLKQL